MTPRVVETNAVVPDELLDSRLRGIWFRRFGRELGLGHSLLVRRRLIEAPRQVGTSERWVMDTSGREKGSMLVGRLVEASGLLKMSSGDRLVGASRLLKMSSVVRAARLI